MDGKFSPSLFQLMVPLVRHRMESSSQITQWLVEIMEPCRYDNAWPTRTETLGWRPNIYLYTKQW